RTRYRDVRAVKGGKMKFEIVLNDSGSIIATGSIEKGQVIDLVVSDWNGNEPPSGRIDWYQVAMEYLDEALQDITSAAVSTIDKNGVSLEYLPSPNQAHQAQEQPS